MVATGSRPNRKILLLMLRVPPAVPALGAQSLNAAGLDHLAGGDSCGSGTKPPRSTRQRANLVLVARTLSRPCYRSHNRKNLTRSSSRRNLLATNKECIAQWRRDNGENFQDW
jgi:hypothetical protein